MVTAPPIGGIAGASGRVSGIGDHNGHTARLRRLLRRLAAITNGCALPAP